MGRNERTYHDLQDEAAVSQEDDESREFKDENGIIHTTSRSLRKVNYAEVENKYTQMDEENSNDYQDMVHDDGKEEEEEEEEDEGIGRHKRQRNNRTPRISTDEENAQVDNVSEGRINSAIDEDDDDEIVPVRRRARSRSAVAEEDESFHEEDLEDEDELEESEEEYQSEESVKRHQRRADRNFIIDDENDADTDEDRELRRNFRDSTLRARRGRRNERSPPRKLRRRTRSAYLNDDNDSEEQLSLAEELKELRDDSPIREKRSLRERTKPVNYTLPPPLPENATEEIDRPLNTFGPSFQSPRSRRGLHAQQSFGPIRRLFPTGGPFGGNDVTAIFGTNTNFYSSAQNVGSNKLLIDSDSSEDEILPLGAPSTKHKEPKQTKKKKPEIADLDPLGVDMNVNFDEVGGLDNYIDQLKEMVALPLLYPELYQNFGITPPRGVLFHGPPGTGKTLMARALAASCSTKERKITFFMRKGADILSKWVGEAERQLRLLFEEAKKQQPSIIFFDEIDGLAPVRSSKQEQIHASIVSTMLALMDGMDNRGQVIVIGATNRPDAVDPALRRPGRFDREFYFPLPDLKARYKILQIHTKKWKPTLSASFLQKLASLTKGYGGADLRALCTEAALISIQRKVPQIYQSDIKLAVDPKDVVVKARDFMLALDKIIPSSARSSGSLAQPLPANIEPLLSEQFDLVKCKLNKILPSDSSIVPRGTSLIKHYLEYEDVNSDEEGFEDSSGNHFIKSEFIKALEKSRTCKPRLLVSGPSGNGQQYIGAAILHYLEHYNVQKLDLESLVSDSTRTLESAIVQTFSEARKRQPSVLYIPNATIWVETVSDSAVLTLASLLRSLKSNEKVLLLAIAEDLNQATNSTLSSLGFVSQSTVKLAKPSSKQRHKYFESLGHFLTMKPTDFMTSKKREKPLPKLPLAEKLEKSVDEEGNLLTDEMKLIKDLRAFQGQDMKLKNALKIKLSGLMDLFKNRYKRFRKPPIDDALLIHLFEPEGYQGTNLNGQSAYVKEGDMILEVATGRKYFNMDLDIVEERLWNGFYSEPKQFLKDIELIYHDAHTFGDRERIIKASEMFANAQMGIEELSSPEFIQECKATRRRELLRQDLFLKGQTKSLNERTQATVNVQKNHDTQIINESEDTHENQVVLGVASDQQLQAQEQIDPNASINPGCSSSSEGGTLPIENRIPDNQELIGSDRVEDEGHPKNTEDSKIVDEAGTVHENSSENGPDNITEESESVKSHPQIENGHNMSNTVSESSTPEIPLPKPQLIVDEDCVRDIILRMEEHTAEWTIEKLEELYASVLSIAWEDRFSWDKSSTLNKISKML